MKKTTYYLLAIMAVAIINTTLGGTANLAMMMILCILLIPVFNEIDRTEALRKREEKEEQEQEENK